MSDATLEADEEAVTSSKNGNSGPGQMSLPNKTEPKFPNHKIETPGRNLVGSYSKDRVDSRLDKGDAETSRGILIGPFHPWKVAVAGLIVLTAIAFGVYLVERDGRNVAGNTDSHAVPNGSSGVVLTPEQRSSVSVAVVEKRTLFTSVNSPGKVSFNSNNVTPVFSQFSGRIANLAAEVGTSVRAGQIIGTIDTPDIVSMQGDYLQQLTAVRSAQTTLDLAKRTRERSSRLAAAEAVPQRDLQQAIADESRATDDLQRAQAAVAAARGRLQSAGMKEAEIARLGSESRAVDRLVPLIAPIAGTITERKAGVGQVVQAGNGDPLFMIADLSTVWVNADVYEDQLGLVHTGGPVQITASAFPGKLFTARVDQIGATLDPDKHTVAVRCVVPNHDQLLKPGMFANVILGSNVPQTVIAVPTSAVVAEGSDHEIFVEEGRGNYVKRTVQTGSELGDSVIILSGLQEGEKVVVRGSLLLSAGKVD